MKVKNESECGNRQKPDGSTPKGDRQKDYERPILASFGDVRDVTLGGSQNPGDPGVPGSTRRNF